MGWVVLWLLSGFITIVAFSYYYGKTISEDREITVIGTLLGPISLYIIIDVTAQMKLKELKEKKDYPK